MCKLNFKEMTKYENNFPYTFLYNIHVISYA
jgi:hypothetical protein